MIDVHQIKLGFVWTLLRRRSRVKLYKLPHVTRDVTGQHYRLSAFRRLSPETWREEEAAEIQASDVFIYKAQLSFFHRPSKLLSFSAVMKLSHP